MFVNSLRAHKNHRATDHYTAITKNAMHSGIEYKLLSLAYKYDTIR